MAKFEAALAESKAVLARSLRETERLADGDHEGYATYYQLTESELRLPEGSRWDLLRRVVDAALFRGYEKNVRFAALSLDRIGPLHYGECSWVLREEMIAHRASVFEENSILFMERRRIPMTEAANLPSGYRAPWPRRAKLCIAKLAHKLTAGTSTAAFPDLLLAQAASPEKEDFVEVHIGGPMTIRSLERIVVVAGQRRSRRVRLRALKAKLAKFAVPLET